MDCSLIPFAINQTSLNETHSKIIYNKNIKHKDFTKIYTIISSLKNQTEDSTVNGLNDIITRLKCEAFNIKGKVIDITQIMNAKNNEEFNTEIRIKSNDLILCVFFKAITKAFAEKLNKLPREAKMYFIHLKAYLVSNNKADGDDDDGGDNNNSHYDLKFYYSNKSRVFQSQLTVNDNNCKLKFNNDITKHYECMQIQKEESIKNNLLRISNGKISNNINYIKHNTELDSFPYDYYDNNNNGSNNELNYIEPIIKDKVLLKTIDDIDLTEKDIEPLLIRKVSSSIYTLKTISEAITLINKPPSRVTVCGIVIGVKIDIKVTCVDILSLIDSNIIKVIHYPNNWKFEPCLKQIISFANIPIKINKNFEFILENPHKANVKLIGTLTDEEFKSYKRFRIGKENMPFSPIISLLYPLIIRSVQKYLVILKDISKVTARIESDYPSGFFDECPSLKLFAKCIVDDSSFEAQLNLYDDDVLKLLKLSNMELKHINSIAQECNNCILYQRASEGSGYISKEVIINNIKKQFIAYCVPYSKIASKHYNDNKFDKYFINLGQKNHLFKNIAMNNTYINGDIFYEKNSIGQIGLLAKPILKALYIEEMQCDDWYLN